MKYLITIIMFIFTITLSGCSKEDMLLPQQMPETPHDIELTFNVPVATEENIDYSTIKTIRVIAVEIKSGIVVYNKSSNASEQTKDQPIDVATHGFTVNIKTGHYNFVVVANENAELAGQLNRVTNENEIKSITINATEYHEANMLFVQSIDNVTVRQAAADPHQGEISFDDGISWMPDIPVALNRLTARVSLKIRKNDSNIGNNIKIVNATICQIPTYTAIIKASYDKKEYFEKAIMLENMITIPDNTSEYTPVFSNTLISENILIDPLDVALSTYVTITALYNGSTVTYTTMLGQWNGTKSDYDNFNVVRNTHYEISATITTEGVYVNDIVMSVADWNNSDNDIDFSPTTPIYVGSWSQTVTVEGNNVIMDQNDVVEYKFKLLSPVDAVWRAHLDNPLDFEFDNGISFGKASNEYQTIRIKRRKIGSKNTISQFHITVNSQEIDLNNNGVIGPDDRFIIINR